MIDTAGAIYAYQGARHDLALRQFSAITADSGAPFSSSGIEQTQAIIFDPEYASSAKIDTGGMPFFVVQLERQVHVEQTPFSVGNMYLTKPVTKRGEWHASPTKTWRHTLNVLGGDHDKEMIVPASHEQVVKDLPDEDDERLAKREKRDAPHSIESSDRPADKSLRLAPHSGL